MPILPSYEAAIAANSHVEDVDQAAIETGRSVAKAIDDILASPEATPTDKTKALYLVPHVMSILRELLATPLARKQVGIAAAAQKKASRLNGIKSAAKTKA